MTYIPDIVDRSGTDDRILGELLGVNWHQVRDWRRRGAIPPEHWQAFATKGLATLEELAAAAAAWAELSPDAKEAYLMARRAKAAERVQ